MVILIDLHFRKEAEALRPLTKEEKGKSQAAKKRANKSLTADRAKHGYALRLLKGSPAIVLLEGRGIVINYDLLRGMHQRLKRRHVTMRIENQILIIVHHATLWGRDKGSIELYELPDYQRLHLTDLPIIDLNTD